MGTWGGKQPGAGRPRGTKTAATLEKERVLAALRQRILKSADSLFNAAKSSALGNQFLFKIVTKMEGGRKVRSKPVVVENPDEISDYIDRLDLFNRGDGSDPSNEDDVVYYFIATKDPNIQAFKELTDRAFGKTTEHSEVTVKMPKPLLEKLRGDK